MRIVSIIPFASLILTWPLTVSCQKHRDEPAKVIPSEIALNSDTTKVRMLDNEVVVFKSSDQFKSYFMATAFASSEKDFLFVATRSKTDDDFDYADLVERKLDLEKKLLSDEKIYIKNVARLNTTAPSFLKIGGKIQLYYMKRESHSESNIFMRESLDGGQTWEPEVRVNQQLGYNIILNDRVIRTSRGRIIVPAAITADIRNGYQKQSIVCYYSEDNGKTWSSSEMITSNIPLMEPSVAEISRGKLIMVIRNTLGKLLFATSEDDGTTWKGPLLSHINSTVSTSAVYKISNGRLALIWNNNSPSRHVFDRTPLSLSVSKDSGKTWSQPYTIANQQGEIYSSPALVKFNDDYFIIYNKSSNAYTYDIVVKKIKID